MFTTRNRNGSRENELTPYMRELTNDAYAGKADAQFSLGMCYMEGVNDFCKDEVKAMRWLLAAGEQQYVPAYGALAYAYLKGTICRPSNEKFALWAARYLEAEAFDGESDSVTLNLYAKELGRILMEGDGVEKDLEKAKHWLRISALKGEALSQLRMGVIAYLQNSCEEAVEWLRKAAEQNNMDAQRILGWCILCNQPTAADLKEARRWLQRAIRQGDKQAVRILQDYFRDRKEIGKVNETSENK